MRGCGANPEAAREPHRVPTQENDDALAQITRILAAAGEANPLDVLMPLVHQDLRRLARAQRRQMEPGETLSTTALVHEAWLSFAERGAGFESQTHFHGYAAIAMRHILVDHARRRMAQKRGRGETPIDLDSATLSIDSAAGELLQLNDALDRLDAIEPRLARVVELRFFAGLSVEETAQSLGIVPRSVVRDWARARVFLQQAIG